MKNNTRIFYIVSLIFIVINTVFIAFENFYFNLVPFVFLIILLAVFAFDKLVFLVVFFTPFSIQLREFLPQIPIDMSLPTEPIMFGIMIVFFIKLMLEKKFDRNIYMHPISIAIYGNLAWIFITSLTSTMPVTSIKFFISRIWFIVVFYFIATQLFRNFKNIKRYIWCYIIPLLMVIAFTLFRLSKYGFFNEKMAHEVMNPIYNDHTSYAAVIAMLVPIVFGYMFSSETKATGKLILLAVLTIFIIGIVFSYTRASWVSIAGALVFWGILKLKIKLKYVLTIAVGLIVLFFVYKQPILMKLEKNRQDSSTNISEHIQSISNVSSDASNVERLNRWSCALRMFEQKPIFGWGPGTYMFKYAPFQLSYEKTIISTNAGDRGNAHSEYIGPLAESGFLGMISFLIIVFYTIFTASKIYKTNPNKEIRIVALILILGLITYYIHGLLNNFLDTDKASALFWGFTAMIVALDVYHGKVKDGLGNDISVTPKPVIADFKIIEKK